jgi:hypothetical protein
MQYETQRRGEARQSLLDKQTAEDRAARLEMERGRFGLEEKRFERQEGLDRLAREKPGRVFTGARGGLWEEPAAGGMAVPKMRQALPAEVSGVAPGTLGPELPPEMQAGIEREGVQMQKYEKPAAPAKDAALNEFRLWVEQNPDRPVSEFWAGKAEYVKPTSFQEEVRFYMQNPELYRVMKGDKPAAFTKDAANKAHSTALGIMRQRYPFGAPEPEQYDKEFQAEFDKALQRLAPGVAAPTATPTPGEKTISLSEIRSRASRLGISVEQAVENAKAAGYEVTP